MEDYTIRSTDAAMPAPEVSVIIPAYNAEKYLAECLESVGSQTERNLEIIVVDDGSTDGTAAIVAGFAEADPRLRLIRQPNGGPGPARNTAIAAARGRYLAFVDADDLLLPHALEHMLAAARRHDAPMVIARMAKGPRLLPKWLRADAEENPSSRVVDYVECLNLALFQHITATSMSGVLFRRELFDGQTFCSTRFEDLDIAYRLILRAERIALLSADVYFYRQHEASYIHIASRARFDVLDVVDRMVGYIGRECPQAIRAAESRRFAAHCNAYSMLLHAPEGMLTPAERTSIEHRCLAVIRQYRFQELFGRRTRLRNRLGALLAYFPHLLRLSLRH